MEACRRSGMFTLETFGKVCDELGHGHPSSSATAEAGSSSDMFASFTRGGLGHGYPSASVTTEAGSSRNIPSSSTCGGHIHPSASVAKEVFTLGTFLLRHIPRPNARRRVWFGINPKQLLLFQFLFGAQLRCGRCLSGRGSGNSGNGCGRMG